MGTNSDLVLDLYYELPGGGLTNVFAVDDNGTGSNVFETLTIDVKGGQCDPGNYYLAVRSYDTNLFGPGSGYDLAVYNSLGGSGGAILIGNEGLPFNYGYFYVSLMPDDALAAGAAWRIVEWEGADTWHNDRSNCYKVQVPDAGHWHIAFNAIPGFSAPAQRDLPLKVGQTITVPATYLYTNPYTNLVPKTLAVTMGADGVFGCTSLGCSGRSYALEESTDLLQWLPIRTNQVPAGGSLAFSITNGPNWPRAFYRWRLIE